MLKKVEEGVLLFDDIWEKVTHNNYFVNDIPHRVGTSILTETGLVAVK